MAKSKSATITTITEQTRIELDVDDLEALIKAQYAYMTDFKIEITWHSSSYGDIEGVTILATKTTEKVEE